MIDGQMGGRRRAWACAGVLMVLLSGSCGEVRAGRPTDAKSNAEETAPGISAIWAVDPTQTGADTPRTGRSLFDFVATTAVDGRRVYDVPFPFAELVKRIADRAGCARLEACVQQTLIPLGRSLQRASASPDFFEYPRVIAAVVAGPERGGALLLKDRIFLGYQEKANLIEIISYNESAGRFEFQLVKDYHAGSAPRVVYASRSVCIACHQNQAPIFSRQQWEETNANPRVAALLEARRKEFYGVAVRQVVDVPNSIDAATDRANLLAVYQRMWREGCGVDRAGQRCRAAALIAALQFRMTGGRAFDTRAVAFNDQLVATLVRNSRRVWPGGLAIPNPDIPNRDPLAFPVGTNGLAVAHVPRRFDPLLPRAPLEIWPADEPQLAYRFVTGIAGFFSERDARLLDSELASLASVQHSPRLRHVAACEVRTTRTGTRFRCKASRDGAGRAELVGSVERGSAAGSIESLAIGDGEVMRHLDAQNVQRWRTQSGAGLSFVPHSGGLRARQANGNAVERVDVSWTPADTQSPVKGEATIIEITDFQPLVDAVTRLAANVGDSAPLAGRPLASSAVIPALEGALGVKSTNPCCGEAAALPSVEADVATDSDTRLKRATIFERYCGACHRTPEPTPPNFLTGDPQQVAAALDSCAPRMFVRLSMWEIEPEHRIKTPMPPALAARNGEPARREYGVEASVAATLRAAVSATLRAEMGHVPTLEEFLARGYESLRPCMPSRS
jgi:mono/diheme cytochrome c family protein